jgi:stage II sporulation protein AA (anti-sigma F factor antagonist)
VNGESAPRGLRWPLRIREVQSDSVVILEVAGRVGHASVDRLATALATITDRGVRGLVVDLAQVDYISSAGLEAIDRAATRLVALGGVLVLCALSESVRIAFDLGGILTRYPVESSRERAIARAGHPLQRPAG